MNTSLDNDAYFDWLYKSVCDRRVGYYSYMYLFKTLHSKEFIVNIPNDINRAIDGSDLRYRYVTHLKESRNIISDIDLSEPCSILEMLIALSIRCEETIMDDTQYGDRTGQWFWSMLNNLGVGKMSDDVFDERKVSKVIENFLNGNYSPNGEGGLFYIPNCSIDLSKQEIWLQLCWYLDSIT